MRMDIDGTTVRLIDSPHTDAEGFTAMLAATFGTCSLPFVNTALLKLLGAATKRGASVSEEDSNAALAFIAAVAPGDELEAAMAVQMYATNELAMEMLSRARHTQDRVATMEYGNLATKLSRTFIGQIEALSKLRRGGEQVVKHVHVYEGGQAVVAGTINQGGGGERNHLDQPHGTGAATERAALPCSDQAEHTLSVESDAERTMPEPRRSKPRRAAR